MNASRVPTGPVVALVRQFLNGRLSVIFLLTALLLGAGAVGITPREEEPQIVVPLADVFVDVPGASPEEVEQLVATPLERLLWQIDGVEYVYSMSRQDLAVVTVRFFVGEDREAALVKLHNRILMHQDAAPAIVKGWRIKPVAIDDVPIVQFTLHSDMYDDAALYRMGTELLARLSEVKNISRTSIVGGRRHEVRVGLIPEKMGGFGLSVPEVRRAFQAADVSVTAGGIDQANQHYMVAANAFLEDREDVASLVVGVHDGRPVHLRDIATITEGPETPHILTRIDFSHFYRKENGMEGAGSRPAVTLAISKKRGTNAVTVSEDLIRRMEGLRQEVLPDGVAVSVTRNYGKTAQEKVAGLMSSLGFAVFSVVLLLALTLGWREALVVAVAVPMSFSLALFVNFLAGYTINRVTLFALILSLGLVVDDPITNVDNIQRNMKKGELDPKDATLVGVQEVLSPVLLSTVAIILCFVPLFFITGMMGPYMAPMAVNVPLTVLFSTLCALTIVPWLSWLLLRKQYEKGGGGKASTEKSGPDLRVLAIYRKLITPFLVSSAMRWRLLGGVVLLFVGAFSLALFRLVPLKLLPFDNKSEFQIVVDMPEGTTLAGTDRVVRELTAYLQGVPEVTEILGFTGGASPMDFNGMVRHYYLRKGPHLGEIRVNLADKNRRSQQSHGLVLRLRDDLSAIAGKHNGVLQIVEVPPGPPVLSTLVAEIYGKEDQPYRKLVDAAFHVQKVMAEEPFVTDLDVMTETGGKRLSFAVDRKKAALHGIATGTILETLAVAVGGKTGATVHRKGERIPLPVTLTVPRKKRSSVALLLQIPVKSINGAMVPLAELVTVSETPQEKTIYHKNLERVVYVTGEVAGQAPAEAVLDIMKRLRENPVAEGIRVHWAGEGEWKITLRVFRDMGLAFAAALLGIYLLLSLQSGSFGMPLLIMMAIPLTLLGILPGFWILNLVTGETIGRFADPVFFTATSMIGMIALGGIVIRNSLVLIEFIQEAVAGGTGFQEAIIQSGAVRLRPIVLTACTTAIGAWPITLDPVFSGLAWALIFGLFASTAFTLMIVPVTYFALFHPGNRGGEGER